MRVAVVGGGVAGLAAAWRLSEVHEVVLYEASDTLGGHAKTIDFKGQHGTQPVDFGFLLCNPWMYSNLFALLDTLGVQARPIVPGVTMSASFPDDHWMTGETTPLRERMQPEIRRFESTMQQVMANPGDSIDLTLGMLLDREGFSTEFQEKFVVPMLAQLFITQHAALDITCLGAAFCIGPTPMLSINNPVPFSTVDQGSREYVRRLAEKISGEVRTSTPVSSIVRSESGVTIVDQSGGEERFDQLVLATDAETALALLDNPTDDEQLLLGDVQYLPCEIVIHSDRSVLPNEQAGNAGYVFVAEGATPQATSTYSTYNLRHIESWLEMDVFATLNPPEGLIDPEKIQYVQTGWKHLLGDIMQALRSGEMHRIQGKQRTWFCGSYISDASWHEGSLCSGLAIAVALGGSYPFPNDQAAKIGFEELATQHMRVLPEEKRMKNRRAMWPAAAMTVARQLTEQMVLKEVNKKLSLGLPEVLFGRYSPLGWIRSLVAGRIAAGVSVYEEAKKEVAAEEEAAKSATAGYQPARQHAKAG